MGRISKVTKEAIIKDIKAKKMGVAKIAAKHGVSETAVKNIKKELACPKCSAKKPEIKKVNIENKNRRPSVVKVSREFPVLKDEDFERKMVSPEEFRQMKSAARMVGIVSIAAFALVIALVSWLIYLFIRG